MTTHATGDFDGAKGAILVRGRVMALLRDDRPGLPWPGRWDLPGGGREGRESPFACLARETREETGLVLSRRDLAGAWCLRTGGRRVWFFVLDRPALREEDLRLGCEGQRLALMPAARFVRHPLAIPSLRARLSRALHARRAGAAIAPRRHTG